MMVGRTDELAVLQRALVEAAAARPQRLLIVGGPGIGKSALLRALRDDALRQDFRVLAAACPSGSSSIRYGVITDLVDAHPDLLHQIPQADREILAHLPEHSSVGPARVATALLRVLSAADRSTPVVVLVDDAHEADSASIAALTFAAGRLLGRRVAIVASTRTPTTDPRLVTWERLEVGPLAADAAVALLREALPLRMRDCLTPERAHELVHLLDGNPAALRECPRLIGEDEFCGRAPLPDPLPASDRMLQGWRTAFEHLSPREQDAALAAFLTEGQGRGLLDRVLDRLGLADAELSQAFGSLSGVPQSRDTHPVDPSAPQSLLRAAVLTSAGPDRVARMSAIAADCSEELALPPAVVVSHLTAAGAGNASDVVVRLRTQADRALGRGQPGVAARALHNAARQCEGPRTGTQLAVEAARILVSSVQESDDAGELLDLLGAADLTSEQRIWVDCLRAQHLAATDLHASLAWMRSAIRHARDADPLALPLLIMSASFQSWAVGDGESALELATMLFEWQESRGPSELPHMAPFAGAVMRGVARFQTGDVVGADADLDAARAASAAWLSADGITDVDLPQLVNAVLMDEVMSTGRTFADPRLDEVLRRLEGDSGETLGIVRNVQAARALRRGDVTIARALVDEGLDLARSLQQHHNILLRLCTAVRIDAIVGDTEALATEVDELRALCEGMGHHYGRTFADRAEGLSALGAMRYAHAAATLSRLDRTSILGMGPMDQVILGRADLVEALVGSGDVSGAHDVLDRLGDVLAPSTDVRARAVLTRAQGVLLPPTSGVEVLRQSLGLWQESNEAFELARTRLLLGEALLLTGNPDAARLELVTAARSFEFMGATPWLARARAADAAVDEVKATPSSGNPTAMLTAAELRVARAVADGATNKEAAARLSLSPRTVEHHLAAAFRKLGVRSRTALVARLADPDADTGAPEPPWQ